MSDNDPITITIDYKKIDLKRATYQGLELLLEMAISQEMYERAAEIKKEINTRKLNPK